MALKLTPAHWTDPRNKEGVNGDEIKSVLGTYLQAPVKTLAVSYIAFDDMIPQIYSSGKREQVLSISLRRTVQFFAQLD